MRAPALLTFMVLLLAVPATAGAQESGGADPSQPQQQDSQASTGHAGGAEYGVEPSELPKPVVAGTKAVLLESGLAAAPADAPPEVQKAVWAANEIVGKPYRYGGGHAKIVDSGYDCSGAISFALHGAGLLESPLHSGAFMKWGERGKGQWITVLTNPGHAYIVIAGLRFDTSAAGERVSRRKGPRWRATNRPMRGFRARHPAGF